MAKIRPRVRVPRSAEAGEVITIKTLISHPMESGLRKDKQGNLIPRRIINKFEVTFNGELAFGADLEPAVSANPYFEFQMTVPETGTVKFVWHDDNGETYELDKEIKVG
jgi:sulfur-oxidizing protein SoxZ